jgi:hypothetical protein
MCLLSIWQRQKPCACVPACSSDLSTCGPASDGRWLCVCRVNVEWLLEWLLCLDATTENNCHSDFDCWKGVSGATPCLGSGALLAFRSADYMSCDIISHRSGRGPGLTCSAVAISAAIWHACPAAPRDARSSLPDSMPESAAWISCSCKLLVAAVAQTQWPRVPTRSVNCESMTQSTYVRLPYQGQHTTYVEGEDHCDI